MKEMGKDPFKDWLRTDEAPFDLLDNVMMRVEQIEIERQHQSVKKPLINPVGWGVIIAATAVLFVLTAVFSQGPAHGQSLYLLPQFGFQKILNPDEAILEGRGMLGVLFSSVAILALLVAERFISVKARKFV